MPLIFTQPYFYAAISNPLAGNPVNTKYTNVSLLMHFDGAWTDASTYSAGNLAVYGNLAFSSTNSKFGSHSLYFDGTGNYGQYANSPQYSFGTGDFTIEAWIYPESLVGSGPSPWNQSTIVAGLSTNGDGGGYDRWTFNIFNDGSLTFNNGESEGSANTFSVRTEPNVIAINKWQHVAVTRSNGVIQFFVDGVTKPGVTKSGVPESVAVTSNGPLRFGRLFNSGTWDFRYKGYMDEVRITKGAARYTTDFDVPTAAFITEPTVLLMHMDGAHNSTVFTDECGAAITRLGNTVLSTANSKFGGTSAYFDGATDYLIAPASAAYGFGTKDFTIEFWMNTNVQKQYQTVFDTRPVGSASAVKPSIQINGNNICYWIGTTQKIITGAIGMNVWYHVAVSRKAGVTRMFINGVKHGEFNDVTDYGTSNEIVLGGVGDNRGYSPGSFSGYLDEVRVMKGVGYYEANFTPPIAPF